MNRVVVSALVVLVVGCEAKPETFSIIERDPTRTSYVDLRGRVSVAASEEELPYASRHAAFAPSDFPGVFFWTADGLTPFFEIKRRAHAGWQGVAQGQYVLARVEFYRDRPAVAAFEKEKLDPNLIAMERLIRTAITNEPTWEEFFEPPVRGVVVVERSEDADALSLAGGIQIVTGSEGEPWLTAARNKTRKPVKLPLFVVGKCIVSAADAASIAACDQMSR